MKKFLLRKNFSLRLTLLKLARHITLVFSKTLSYKHLLFFFIGIFILNSTQLDHFFISKALELATKASSFDEVPVGALITQDQEIIAEGFNQKENLKNPLLHAEIIAITKATKKLNTWRLSNCTLYTTLEPCLMCAGALIQARIKRVVFSAYDKKGGAFGSLYHLHQDSRLNHQIEICAGIYEKKSQKILQDFFKNKRKQKTIRKLDETTKHNEAKKCCELSPT